MPGPDDTLLGAICPTSLPHKRNYVAKCRKRAAAFIRAQATAPIRAPPHPLAPPSVYVKVSSKSATRESFMALPAIFDRLRLPALGSPLFIVSGPSLVLAPSKAGTVNQN